VTAAVADGCCGFRGGTDLPLCRRTKGVVVRERGVPEAAAISPAVVRRRATAYLLKSMGIS
jgi:hypothetical protein